MNTEPDLSPELKSLAAELDALAASPVRRLALWAQRRAPSEDFRR